MVQKGRGPLFLVDRKKNVSPTVGGMEPRTFVLTSQKIGHHCVGDFYEILFLGKERQGWLEDMPKL